MTDILDLLRYEEGWRPTPYLCSKGYPTIGFGFKIGPKGAPLKYYDFEITEATGEVWMTGYLENMVDEIKKTPAVNDAYTVCNADSSARVSVLLSMCYQMGVQGVAEFRNTLKYMKDKEWELAASGMRNSLWARQTPERAQRHAEQMRTGKWAKEYAK